MPLLSSASQAELLLMGHKLWECSKVNHEHSLFRQTTKALFFEMEVRVGGGASGVLLKKEFFLTPWVAPVWRVSPVWRISPVWRVGPVWQVDLFQPSVAYRPSVASQPSVATLDNDVDLSIISLVGGE